MALYDMTQLTSGATLDDAPLVKVERTSFASEGIQERAHLQAALRDHIDLISEDLFVVAEEFGDFEGAQRRIDLLCIDRDGGLVVVELKRTVDGGHMELQALRYAAMVSTMTFSQVVRAFAKYRRARGATDVGESDARTELLAWMDLPDDEEPVIPREVGIVLASEDFSQEISTTVLWLNEFHGFDIRCIRLSPYRLQERLLLDVQPVIPLPEASSYTVRVREKEKAVKQATESAMDLTKFVVTSSSGSTQPLPKRWAMLRVVEALVAADVPMDDIRAVLPASKTLRLPGTYDDSDARWAAVQETFGKSDVNRKRWHVDDPLIIDGSTWLLGNNWGLQSREFFEKLQDLAPEAVSVSEAADE